MKRSSQALFPADVVGGSPRTPGSGWWCLGVFWFSSPLVSDDCGFLVTVARVIEKAGLCSTQFSPTYWVYNPKTGSPFYVNDQLDA